ncbi:MAG: tetratricopeptide repeat protein [Phaeospirillum sp.]|nr:tetratricopeptide repeat protein [Phaeospirillum sp.]
MSTRLPIVLALILAGCTNSAVDGERAVIDAVEPSLRAAAAAAEAGHDYKGAAQHLGTLYQRRGDDKGIGVALARNLRYGGQPQAAADIIQGQLTRFPRDPDLLIELGKDYLAADRIALALRMLEQALAVAPERWEVHATMAVALDTLGRNSEALAAYGRALELSPENPAIMNNLGLSQALAGRLDDGLATLGSAADLPTATAQIRQNLALLLALKGDAAQAEKLTRNNLPPDVARANIDVMRAIAAAVKQP